MNYVLGIDLGTSSLKGIVIDQDGVEVATSISSYGLISSKKGYSEQNPAEWIKALKLVLNDLIKCKPDIIDRLSGISISGQMHSLVLLDDDGIPLRNAILWNDVRTTSQCREINEKYGNFILKITKNKALEGFTLPKILWVQENEPHIWNKTTKILLPKDYLGFWLTGKYQTDYSDAAGTLLLDSTKNVWSTEILSKFEIEENILPELISANDLRGNIRNGILNELGFKNSVAVFGGGADNACAALSAGIVSPDIGMCSIGTSGVFLTKEKIADTDYDGQVHFFNDLSIGSYYSMGVTLSAGNSLNWFKRNFAYEQDFSELLKGITDIEPGSEGLLFTPYINGERTPYVDSQIRGSFIGIDFRHQLKHFTRSVIEGITFSLKESQKLIELKTNKKVKKIVSVGGGSKNIEWLQIQADIFQCPVVTLDTEQGPALGAAMLAAIGCGWYKNEIDAVDNMVRFNKVVVPRDKEQEKYERIFQVYRKVYDQTRNICYDLTFNDDLS